MDDVLDKIPGGFLSLADDGTICAANETLSQLLGYTADELTGSKLESILTVANRIFYQTHFFPLLRLHGRADEIFLSLLSKDGEEVPVLVNAARLEVDGGHRCYLVIIPARQRRKYEDELLRAKKAAEEALRTNAELAGAKRQLLARTRELDRRLNELEQRNRELRRLNHVLSHDLREPIRKISFFADLLAVEDRTSLSPGGQRAVDRIGGSAKKLGEMVTSLRQYLSLDERTERPAELSLDDLLNAACARVCERTPCDELRLAIGPLPVVEGYRRQLMLMFENLIDNSIKFCRPREPVAITVGGQVVRQNSYRSLEGKYRYVDFARIDYQDNSRGFDEKYADRVFDILTKLESDTPGLGFGLAVCKRVVDNHSGSINVRPNPGAGLKFIVMLPLKRDG